MASPSHFGDKTMTMIAQMDTDGTTVLQIGEDFDLYPAETFPADGPDAQWMLANNVLLVYYDPPFNPVTQQLEVADQPYVLEVNGVKAVYLNVVQDLTPDQITAAQAIVMHNVNLQRNLLIDATNWTQIADSGLAAADVAAWATYRLAVRQACQNFQDSDRTVEPVWPTPPQDVIDYSLLFLSQSAPAPIGGTSPPPPAPTPAPAPAPSPTPEALSPSSGTSSV